MVPRSINDDTICALSTAPGVGAIAIVRLSGPEAFSIVQKIFLPRLSQAKNSSIKPDPTPPQLSAAHDWQPKSHQATIGYIVQANQELVDEVVLIPYKGPNSYTGEDMVEINCHGSPIVTREILNLALQLGARLAQAGEFTKRGFLAGRIDLTQAEAVLDLIHSKTERQSRLALTVLKGQLGEEIKAVRSKLMELLTRIVAGIDFPEEVGDLPTDDIESITHDCIERLNQLAKTARSGRYLREGLKLAIVGRPNAGKSSLLNQMLNFERAIVTDIPGTTRDSIEEPIDVNGIPVILIDTAGVRVTEDAVEKIGIARTSKAIEASDLVVFLLDLSQGIGVEEEVIAAKLIEFERPYLIVKNKVDLKDKPDQASLQTKESPHSKEEQILKVLATERAPVQAQAIDISARYGNGLGQLKAAIEEWALAGSPLQELGGSLNQRQGQLCLRALESLNYLKDSVRAGLPHDCLGTDLRQAVDALDEISGVAVTEEVITEVFANFCIGK
ncbi:tRNA uridine-5-carboxymethylaminomethyl(34) synthesis GTPase MnmE [bacterium]|nr:tRNA uridine-5-carboxymethylaminomethyl(34) synthesis GTPase MnmE [bacterium]MBP9810127.1 tRNA uridine-5-carboxymethylaminomethyl(34) synthesis GTPase MnmE [bacterium]